jgi:hypothetical protein
MLQDEKWALVTGGSSGIGMELSKLLAKDGYSLIIVAKPQEELDQAKGWFDEHMSETRIVYRQQDLAVQDAAQKLYDFTSQNGYDIDILCNNAGFGAFGWHYDLEIERVKSMLNLLVITTWELTRLYVKDMIEKDRGKILITSSQGAFMPSPKSAAYAGGKSFSFYFGMALNQELKEMGSKVTLTVLCPPPTRTGFAKEAGMDHLQVFDKKSRSVKKPKFVAKKGYKALKKGKRLVSPGFFGRIITKLLNPLARARRVVLLMKLSEWGSK